MIGAGAGAGLGSFVAWLRVDRAPPASVLLVMAMALLLAGVGGAWGGYQFGANQEIECCIGPAITPISYTAMGAAVGSSAAALVMGIAHEIKAKAGRAKFRAVAGGSAIATSSVPRHIPH